MFSTSSIRDDLADSLVKFATSHRADLEDVGVGDVDQAIEVRPPAPFVSWQFSKTDIGLK